MGRSSHFERRNIRNRTVGIMRPFQLGSSAGGEISQAERPRIGEETGIGQFSSSS